jgi:hypothetical protein
LLALRSFLIGINNRRVNITPLPHERNIRKHRLSAANRSSFNGVSVEDHDGQPRAIARWGEDGKQHQHGFSIRKYGEADAIVLAVSLRAEADVRLGYEIRTPKPRLGGPDGSLPFIDEPAETPLASLPTAKKRPVAARQSGVRGVNWDERRKSWKATWTIARGKTDYESFSTVTLGEAEALQMAIAHRAAKVAEYGRAFGQVKRAYRHAYNADDAPDPPPKRSRRE